MPSAPRITVGIPFFDEEKVLAQAIRSILGQTFDDIELLLMDDGSSDGSLEIARSFTDPRVTVISDGVRRHLPARLNEIARRAKGALVARMDADDVSHPQRLAKELAMLDRDPRCDAVGTSIALIDADERPFAVMDCDLAHATPASVLLHGLIPHATMLARRDWLRANPYDERLDRAEDRDLWCRTFASSTFGVVPEVLYVVRVSTKGDFLAKYLASQRQNAELILRYGPASLGLVETARRWMGAQAKSVVMASAAKVGLADRVVRRRGRAPTSADLEAIRESLHAARQST